MIKLLKDKRETLLNEMRQALESTDYQQEKVDDLKTKIENIDQKITSQRWLETQAKQETENDPQLVEECRRYSLSNAIIARLEGRSLNGREAEIQTEIRSKTPTNLVASGDALHIPAEVFETRQLTTTDAGANALHDSFRPGDFLTTLRPMTVSGQLGIRMIAGTGSKIKIPKQVNVMMPHWSTETGSATTSKISFAAPIEFEAHRLTCASSYSEQLLRESASGYGLPIQSIVVADAMREMSIAIDQQILVGGSVTSGAVTDMTNAPNKGILGEISSSRAVAATAKAITYDEILDMTTATKTANAPQGRQGFVCHPVLIKYLKQQLRITGASATSDTIVGKDMLIDGYPTTISTMIPINLKEQSSSASNDATALIYSSNWSDYAMVAWGSLQLIVDPYTSKAKAITELVWHQFLDMGFIREESFRTNDNIDVTA